MHSLSLDKYIVAISRLLVQVAEEQKLTILIIPPMYESIMVIRGEILIFGPFPHSLLLGRLQACCQRILVNLTYQNTNFPTPLLAVLPLTYNSCMRLPTTYEMKRHSDPNTFIFEERTSETYIAQGPTSDFAIGSDAYLGRLLFFRVLTKAVQLAGTLQAVPSINSLSPELRSCTIQLTSPKVIDKIVRTTLRRHINRTLANVRTLASNSHQKYAYWKSTLIAELGLSVLVFTTKSGLKERWRVEMKLAATETRLALKQAASICSQLGLSREAETLEAGLRIAD